MAGEEVKRRTGVNRGEVWLHGLNIPELQGTVNLWKEACRLSIVAAEVPIQPQHRSSMMAAGSISPTARLAMAQKALGTEWLAEISRRHLHSWHT